MDSVDAELAVLQALRIKGRAQHRELAAATGVPQGDVERITAGLVHAGEAREGNGVLILLSPARGRLERLLAHERRDVDIIAVNDLYEEFVAVDRDFKRLASDWQMRDGEFNDHDDPAYDDEVLERLGPIHERASLIVRRVAEQVPRLGRYKVRLEAALERVLEGDHSWLLRSLIDSYHTVWCELHEELIALAGQSSLAGRGRR